VKNVKRAIVGGAVLIFTFGAFAASLAAGIFVPVFVLLIGWGGCLELASIVCLPDFKLGETVEPPDARAVIKAMMFWGGEMLLVTGSMLATVGKGLPIAKNEVVVFFGALLLVFAQDAAAMVIGRAFPTARLPGLLGRASPNKTIGGLVGSVALAEVMGVMGAIGLEELGVLVVNEKALLAVLLIPIIAPAGDLFESAMKRQFRVKNSGDLLRLAGGPIISRLERFLEPHGGILDRFDSFFPVIIFLALLS
jgi:CDP-diglyceride synthetase